MKTEAIVVILFLHCSLSSSQVLVWEETPWGESIPTYTYTEAHDTIRESGDDYWGDDYPDVVYLDTYGVMYSSTDRFNCNGWAWYMSDAAEGSGLVDPRAIYKANGTIKYISDGISYNEVTETEADIVWWTTRDHSALTTDVYRVWTSKWQTGPLVQHDWDDSPYGTTGLKFYKRCFFRLSGIIVSDVDEDYCKIEFSNSIISDNVEVVIEYEDWLKVDNGFSTGDGTVLDFRPISN